jgi:hypothetical protein
MLYGDRARCEGLDVQCVLTNIGDGNWPSLALGLLGTALSPARTVSRVTRVVHLCRYINLLFNIVDGSSVLHIAFQV